MKLHEFTPVVSLDSSEERNPPKREDARTRPWLHDHGLLRRRMKLNVLMFTMSRRAEWLAGTVNRNRQIAAELEKDPAIGRIVYVDLLPHSWKRAAKIYFQDFITKPKGRIIGQTVGTRLTEVQPGKIFHVVSFEPIVSETQFLRSLAALLRKIDFRPDILWSYLPTYVQCFTKIDAQTKVFDAVDDWSAHPAYKQWKKRLKKNYQFLNNRADVVFTVSKELLSLFPHHRYVHWVPNGADIEHFSASVQMNGTQKHSKPTIVYVGIIQERVDLGLIAWLARQRPQYDFVIAGPVWKGIDVSTLHALPNVRMPGAVAYDELPELLARCSVGIVPHKADGLVRSMNPMKIYDYLSAGLPVVATQAPGFEAFQSGMKVVASRDTFLTAVDEWVAHPPSTDSLRTLVAPHSWHARYKAMSDVIDGFSR